MAAGTPRDGSGITLPDGIAAEVTADWHLPNVMDGTDASIVNMQLGPHPTSRSNQQYQVLKVARAAFTAPTGKRIGANSWVTPAVEEVLPIVADPDADPPVKAVKAVPAVPAMIEVQTRIKDAT